MTVQQYSTVASRNLIKAEEKMLKMVEDIRVLGHFGEQKQHPLNKTDTIVFRRIAPYGSAELANPAVGYSGTPSITASSFVTSEGVTPTANTISYTDITVSLTKYAALFKFTDKAQLMYEDNIPDDMVKVCSTTLAEVAELAAYGFIRAGSSVLYANGSTRVGLNTGISLNLLRKAVRAFETNRATMVTSAIEAGPNFGTAPVEPGYPVFVHSHLIADCRALPGFTKRVEYGSAIKPIHPREFGECEGFRFISSPIFAPFLAAGAAYSGTGMLSAGSANCDVYPVIIMAEGAWGHVSLKGYNYSGIKPTIISSQDINHANPTGSFGYVGANFWYGGVRLNENHMLRIECCASDLA